MRNAESQTGLGRRHVRNAKDLECRQHEHQPARQDAQAMGLQARQPELLDMPHFKQTQ
jgi:hypothetical protein